MSPALLTKYLQAARLVADHMYLNPNGFEFAPHPMLVETDREKYCIQQIVDFYDRQPTDYSDYFRTAWMYKHRAVLGKPKATLADIGRAEQSERAVPDDHLAGARGPEGRGRAARKAADDVARAAGAGEGVRSVPRSVHTDARLRPAHAQGHGAEVRQPRREAA